MAHTFLFTHCSHGALEATLPMAIGTLHTGYWIGQGSNMEQRLWAVAFILALLKTSLDFFHGRRGKVTLETRGFNSREIKITHPLVQISGNSFPCNSARTPLPLVTDRDTEDTPLVTLCARFFISSTSLIFLYMSSY